MEWKKDGYSIHQIIELSGLKRSQVYATLKVHRETGSVQNPYARPRGRKRILTIDDHTFVESTVRTNPSLILPEVQERLNNLRGVSVSTSTLSRTSDRLGLSRKRLAHRASERNPLLRATWIAEHGGYPMSYYLWLDESGIDELTCQRRTGWARKGVAPVQQQTFIRGTKYSVLPVLTSSGIPVMEIVEGSINKDVFINFLKTQVVCVLSSLPYPLLNRRAIRRSSISTHFPDLGVLLSLTTARFTMTRKFAGSSRTRMVCICFVVAPTSIN